MTNPNTTIAELLAGTALGVLNAATNTSGATNIVSTTAGSLGLSAAKVWPFKDQGRFFSSQTALTALNIVGSSAVSHLITDAIIHRHHAKPTIVFAPDCNNSEKSWVAKTSQATEQAEMGR
jgi:hypothetical protein